MRARRDGFVRFIVSRCLLVCGVAALLSAGCADSTGGSMESSCVPGRTVECVCSSGSTGTQTCGDDGEFGPCECSGSDVADAGMEVGEEPGGDASTDGAAGEDTRRTDTGRDTGRETEPSIQEVIRTEVAKPTGGPNEPRPLPVATHWNSRYWPLSKQAEHIEDGHHILPFTNWPGNDEESAPEGLQQIAEWNLPLEVIHGLQWTRRFTKWDWGNDAVFTDGGDKLDPEGPTEEWKKLGRTWTDNKGMQNLQQIHPDPPAVHLISNHERINEVDGANYRDQDEALFEGLREGLTESAWKNNTRVLGYQAAWPPWDGGGPSYYDFDWQPEKKRMNFWSAQTHMMNHVPVQRAILEAYPEQWYELNVWDGAGEKAQQYEDEGLQPTTPKFYRGWVQYGMWLMRPRAVRQWNDYRRKRTADGGYWPKMKEIIKAVDVVHEDPVLTRFWRRGRLVPNTEHTNPFYPGYLGDGFKEENRYFLLDTSVDPERPWDDTTRLPVFSLARVIDGQQREWLLYAHAPMGDEQDVEVEIPNYEKITVDVAAEGSFYHVKESDGSVTEVGQIPEGF